MKTTATTAAKLVIGDNCEITSFYQKLVSFGRRRVLVELLLNNGISVKDVYLMDVCPNLIEHYQHAYILQDEAWYHEDGTITRLNGAGDYELNEVFANELELLQFVADGMEVTL